MKNGDLALEFTWHILVHILENICIAQDILENMNTIQDALSGMSYNVYSFALMFRLPGLQLLMPMYISPSSLVVLILYQLSIQGLDT